MRILHVNSKLDTKAGGTIAGLIGMATAQAEAGLSVSVLGNTWPGDDLTTTRASLSAAGVALRGVGPSKTPLGLHPDLSAAVDEAVQAADIVHIHALWEQIQHLAAKAARRHGKPYVVTPHGMLTPWSLAQSKWRKRLFLTLRVNKHLDRAAAIHMTTEMERDGVKALNLRPPLWVEPLGLDVSEFETLPPAGAFRRRHPQIGDKPLIAFLGRLHPGKGMEYLIPALAQMPVKATLVAVGPDSEGFMAKLKSDAEQLGVADRVIFTGLLAGRDRIEALADADLFALPSDHENFGMAIIEALAAGTPVLISKHVAIEKPIREAGVGAVAPQEPAALAAELSRWLGDNAMRNAAAEKARPFVWRTYDRRQVATNWVRHYQQVVNSSSRLI